MTDERFDEAVRAWAARRRADVPLVPAARVWDRIEPAVGAEVGRARGSAHARLWWWRAAAAAALLLVGVGIGLGIARFAGESRPTSTSVRAPRRLPPGQRAYAAAAHDHLVRVGALVDAVARAEADDRALDERLVADARALLATTRLLLDAPSADSARLRPLLDDLEITLARIVELRGGGTAGQRALVTRALRRRDILPRIRAATAAGPARGDEP